MGITGEFDHELKIDSTTEKFRLVRDDNKQAMYSIENFVPNYRNPLTFTQKNWVGGHGQNTMKVPDKYFEGQSIDTTQEGRVFLGGAINTVIATGTAIDIGSTASDRDLRIGALQTAIDTANPANATGTLTSIEIWAYTNITGMRVGTFYLVSGSTYACRDSATLGSITAGSKQTVTTDSSGNPLNISVTSGDYIGCYFATGELESASTGGTAWCYKVGEYIDAGDSAVFQLVTGIALSLYATGTTTIALDSAPVKFVWFPYVSKWICATSGKIYLYNNTKWVPATTTVAGVTDLCVFGTTIFAACGTSVAYKYSTDGDTWTPSTLANLTHDKYANYFFVAPNSAGTAEVLWKSYNPNELQSTTDGTNTTTNWSSYSYIGDTSTNITNIFLVNDNLMIGKTDGLWHYDSAGGIHQLRPDLAKNISTDNFKYITEWQGGVYFSEINGMGELTSVNAYAPMGALHDVENIGKRGDIVGLASDKDFLYVAIDEGTNTHIYKGREIWRDGIGLRWEWCPWIFLSTYTCATMSTCQHSTTDRRLWFGYTTGTTYGTAYVILSDNPTADSNYRFTTSGFLKMSYDYGTDPQWDKLWQSAIIEQRRYTSGVETAASSGETVALKYRDDTDLPSADATSIITAYNTAGIVETNFSSAITNKRVSFELWLASDTNNATPEVSYFQAKGIEKPTTTRIHEMVYSIGDEPTEKAKTLRDLLRTARTSTSLIKFSDLRYLSFSSQATGGTAGTDYVYCVMEPSYPQEVEIIHRNKGTTPELGIRVRLREVSFA